MTRLGEVTVTLAASNKPANVKLPAVATKHRRPPPLRQRLAVTLAIATAASLLPYLQSFRMPWPGDFGLVWFSAQALLHGANPYVLVGPGLVFDWPWQVVLYPGTAMIAGMPFALLPQLPALVLFVWVSTALLAYAITADGWYRLPLFLSWSFVVAADAAQWSPILTAALCIPSLAWVLAAKPNMGLALLAAATTVRTVKVAFVGAVVLSIISLLVFPTWPLYWLRAIRSVTIMHAPILLPGGVFVLLALLRWRRPEARLIVALACVPQTNSWYEALPLLLVPISYRESVALSFVSSCGVLLQRGVVAFDEAEYNRIVGILMVAFVYLPATLLVLYRPNEGELPPFVARLSQWARARRTISKGMSHVEPAE